MRSFLPHDEQKVYEKAMVTIPRTVEAVVTYPLGCARVRPSAAGQLVPGAEAQIDLTLSELQRFGRAGSVLKAKYCLPMSSDVGFR